MAESAQRTADTATQQAVDMTRRSLRPESACDAAEGRERNLREALQQIAELKTQMARTTSDLDK